MYGRSEGLNFNSQLSLLSRSQSNCCHCLYVRVLFYLIEEKEKEEDGGGEKLVGENTRDWPWPGCSAVSSRLALWEGRKPRELASAVSMAPLGETCTQPW